MSGVPGAPRARRRHSPMTLEMIIGIEPAAADLLPTEMRAHGCID
jgi:hypothetical protein